MSEKPVNAEKQCIVYFQPRQIIFHAHGNLDGVAGVIPDLLDWANGIASSKGINLSVGDNQSVFDFSPFQPPVVYLKSGTAAQPAGIKPTKGASLGEKLPSEQKQKQSYTSPAARTPPPFSLVFAEATSEKWSQKPSEKALAEELKELLALIRELDKRRGEAPISLEVVSPNWLMGSTSEPGGTGGPGGPPAHVKQGDIPNHKFALTAPSSDPAFANISHSGGGSEVVVAILDTAYPDDQREAIYNAWVSDRPGDEHPVIKALLGSDGCLQIHNDRTVDSYLPDMIIPGHDYDMTDHGFFVAGIINSIAPNAELHLYEVLNKHGLGDLRTIANALQDVVNRFRDRPLVVNLSLTMSIPLEEGHLRDDDTYGLGQTILDQKPWWLARLVAQLFNWIFGKPYLCTCDSWLERQARPFEWICDLVYTLNSRVIAAAGNNHQAGKGRPSALYPAAFDRAFGVGALPKDIPPTGPVPVASYSNIADTPSSAGITTFGGEPGAESGVLGVYLGPFPDGEANDNGWAWWCGTSFATPVISGMTAVVLSNLLNEYPGRRFTTEDAIARLYGLQARETRPWNEDVLEVKQSS